MSSVHSTGTARADFEVVCRGRFYNIPALSAFELETNIREQLAAICSRYNLSLEEAFTSFAEVVVQAGRLPYDMEVPNAVTQAAMAAAEKGEGLSGAFDSAPELMAALGYTRGNSRRYTLEELDNEE